MGGGWWSEPPGIPCQHACLLDEKDDPGTPNARSLGVPRWAPPRPSNNIYFAILSLSLITVLHRSRILAAFANRLFQNNRLFLILIPKPLYVLSPIALSEVTNHRQIRVQNQKNDTTHDLLSEIFKLYY